ncbi:hypothetical protein L596_025410 [Steinernema carpocapsae]|uniref:DNA2/NAM7 helicase helicase domain-containing protein n=1 Tax=Steinernema carpocapsae TaxID=34508 RepID=A0A4U5M7P9_STECR|nr:hypothetical protein L596_025410 [Steinernema carpocapsae]
MTSKAKQPGRDPGGYERIKQICEAGSTELIQFVTSRPFDTHLKNMWDDPRYATQILNLILAAVSSPEELTDVFIFQFLRSDFFDHLVHFLGLWYEKDQREILNIYLKLLKAIRARSPSVQVQSMTKIREELTKKLLLDIDHKKQRDSKQVHKKTDSPKLTTKPAKKAEAKERGLPENFREISVIPTMEDLASTGKPYLRKNKIEGQYDDSEHYLDVQFRLLREDLLDPLRTGVADYLTKTDEDIENRVYENVQVDFPELQLWNHERVMSCTVRFEKRLKCVWNRQFKFGSLVMLSQDGFQKKFVFGVVNGRSDERLKKGEIGIFFEEFDNVDPYADYKMIESSAYYEAYRPVLKSLQAYHVGEKIPFQKFLVDGNTAPNVPSYLKKGDLTLRELDFGVLCGDRKQSKFLDVREAPDQLTPEEIGLDDSQHKALTMAFQQELALIQGPPGTGKTHLGYQIVRVLLANEHIWNPNQNKPLLVVCYTNRALDQFLNGILDIMEEDGDIADLRRKKLIRVGAQCKDERLQEHLFYKVKQRASIAEDIEYRLRDIKDDRNSLSDEMADDSKWLNTLKNEILDFQKLRGKIDLSSIHSKPGKNQIADPKTSNYVFIDWLTKYERSDPTVKLNGEDRMDLSLIDELVRNGYQEQLAKNLSFKCHNNLQEIRKLYEQSQHTTYIRRLANAPLPETQNWPSIANMKELMTTFKVGEIDAYDALVKHKGDVNKARQGLLSLIKQKRLVPLEPESDNSRKAKNQHRYNPFGLLNVLKNRPESTTGGQLFQKLRMERLKSYTDQILAAKPFSEREANRVTNMWNVSLPDRWRLYKFWVKKISDTKERHFRLLNNEYNEIIEELQEVKLKADVEYLKSPRVLGMTTTSAARLQEVLKTIKCSVVIVEEAAQVLESHIVTSLTVNTKHAILIGDHKQLRPTAGKFFLCICCHSGVNQVEHFRN